MEYTLKKLPKEPKAYADVISEQVVTWHHDKHQAGYVTKLNEIESKLMQFDQLSANANYSDWSDAKRRVTFNKAGIVLHENYWEVFGSDGKFKDSQEVIKMIQKSFGTVENWMADFTATAKSALGWAVLVYDPNEDKMTNVLVDYHNNGAMWGTKLIIALDVFEHAYYKDYGPDRAGYIAKFMASLDWENINKIYTKCDCSKDCNC
ncbi:MAG: Fe-Mn family superoxide dismutase [bacterium]